MALRRKTLRRLSPLTRDGFKLLADLESVESVERRLRNYLARVQEAESDAATYHAAKRNANGTHAPLTFEEGEWPEREEA